MIDFLKYYIKCIQVKEEFQKIRIYSESPSLSSDDDDDGTAVGAGTITTCFPLAFINAF